MQAKDLRPAKAFAQRNGVKALVYGGPGAGKTPVFNTAPRPLLLAIEPGLLSMRNSDVPTWNAPTVERIEEFFLWFFQSAEAKQFDTLGVDSVSEMAEVYLAKMLVKHAHGLKAYGETAEAVLKHVNKLYFMPEKHLYLICKQTAEVENGVSKRRPYFPGKQLNAEIPHKFDEIFHLGLHNIPGVVGQQKAFCTADQFDLMARDRSGSLNMFEPPDLTAIFKKAMA